MHTPVLLFFGNLFSSDMIIIAFVALLLFGGEKLPEIARGLGKGIRDFKDASEGIKREINDQINNFEVKREEEKKIEELKTVDQHASQNQLPASTTDHLNTGYQPVENTIQINESYLSGGAHTEIGNNEAVHTETVNEHHVVVPHEEAGTNEPIKNS